MSALSPILRMLEGNKIMFFCPGCKDHHTISIKEKADGKGWTWNGSVDKPTFTPSILTTNGHFVSGFKKGDACWCTYNAEHPERPSKFGCQRCHSFVTDGQIRFLSDCSHSLAGKTVPLPDFTEVGT